jgi:general secretion pathway protein F
MPVYQYKGVRNDGLAATGIVDAESPKVARQKLRKGGVYPTSLIEQQGASDHPRVEGQSKARVDRFGVLSKQELAIMTRQLATLLVAGLPLVEVLGILVEQTDKKAAQGVLADIREQVRGGKSLSAALEGYPRNFGQLYIHMVRAGETSGALDQILFRLAEFLEKQVALNQRVTNAMIYPALMSVVAVTVLFFLLTFVVPKITAVFTDLHRALPTPTIVLMAISQFLANYWWLLLGGAAIGILTAHRTIQTPAGRKMADRIILSLPLVGELARMVAVSRLSRTLATMLASGVQLLEALDVAKRVMNNRVLEEAVEAARQNIREGETIADPLKRSGEFPSLVTHMIAVGERSGEMEDMLQRISQIYDGEVERVIARLTSLLEPIMILVMGMVVFFIVVAILLPIFEMGQMVG